MRFMHFGKSITVITEAGTVRCNLQVTLCDPYLSALSVRYYNKGAI